MRVKEMKAAAQMHNNGARYRSKPQALLAVLVTLFRPIILRDVGRKLFLCFALVGPTVTNLDDELTVSFAPRTMQHVLVHGEE